MKAQQHPEYDSERAKLTETIALIQGELEKLTFPIEASGADNRGAQAVRRVKLDKLDKLKQARKELYFGRVDWKADDQSQPETFYLGKIELSDMQIYNWRDTMPARIYYEGRCQEKGKRLLRRTYKIETDQLDDITDEEVAADRTKLMGLSLPPVSVVQIVPSDELLAKLLEQTREGHLHDIVATIQAEQFRLIRSPLNQILVIQGVAGSGKTAIALHRIAYLLFQHESKGELARQRILYLGPNPIFLNYVAHVLPELGERLVPQMSFDEWMLSRLDSQPPYEPEELALEGLLDPTIPTAKRILRYRNARNKGSLTIARMLDRYVDHLVEQITTELGDFSFEYRLSSRWALRVGQEALQCTITAAEVRDLITKARIEQDNIVPLNKLKPKVQILLAQTAYFQLGDQISQVGAEERDELVKRVRPQVGQAVEKYLRPWESFNVSVAYRGLLRSPDLLQRMGESLFNRWELEQLHIDAPKQGTLFRFSDLGALLYLHLLLEGVNTDNTLDHIVIDEAQDITPLQFLVLKRWSRNQSMTLMGDLAQGIYSDHGLQNWDDLNTVFSPTPVEQRTMRQSYRSTQQIMEYANRMLRRTGVADDQLAIPLSRSGPEPFEHSYANQAEQLTWLRALLMQEQSEGLRSIAIILKTAKACRELAAELEAVGIAGVQLIDNRTIEYKGGVALLPVYLAKGLEFDTVIIADADATTYPALSLEARLLYVALTRASHRLHVGWIGQVTPLLYKTKPDVQLVDHFEEQLPPHLVTIEQFAQSTQPALDPDTCVERLASAGKLHLLDSGLIDETTLAVLAASWNQPAPEEEVLAPELDPQLQNAVRTQVGQLAGRRSNAQDALAFLQVSFGLLRSVLRTVGIMLADEQETDPREQAVALARFLNALRTARLAYSVGQPTTERRVLQAVTKEWQTSARKQLQHLKDHGIVETFAQAQGERIRVSYPWIESLLLAALGHPVEQWDPDLRAQLPNLPSPISQQIIAPGYEFSMVHTDDVLAVRG